jgi:hypothetical protein
MVEIGTGDRFAAYADALRRDVCRTCLDGRGDGACGLASRACPLDEQLPAVIAAIQSIHSSNLDDYTRAVEASVCSNCSNRAAGVPCGLREHADCALIAYLPLVIEAVEESH